MASSERGREEGEKVMRTQNRKKKKINVSAFGSKMVKKKRPGLGVRGGRAPDSEWC